MANKKRRKAVHALASKSFINSIEKKRRSSNLRGNGGAQETTACSKGKPGE